VAEALRVSVAMATYRGERFLREQLESLARQTRLPDELVVCDDRSPDGTWSVLEGFRRDAPFPVRLHRNETNLGVAGNFTRAATLCEGDAILFCDQDDVWLPQKVERLMEPLEREPAVAVSFSDLSVVDEALRPLGYTMWGARGFGAAQQEAFRAAPVAHLVHENVVTGCAMAMRASLRKETLPVPAGWIHDAWIALLAAMNHDLAPVPDVTVLYRQHAANATGANKQSSWARVRKKARDALADPTETFRRDARYWGEAARAMRRLGGRPDRLRDLARLEERVAHLEARAALPPRRLARVAAVSREWREGRYARHSGGAASAVKDLVGRRRKA